MTMRRTFLYSILNLIAFESLAESYNFGNEFLGGIDSAVLKAVNNNSQPEGVYNVMLSVNGKEKTHAEIYFYSNKEDKALNPCITKETLDKISYKSEEKKHLRPSAGSISGLGCLDFSLIKEYYFEFDFISQSLNLYFPDSYLEAEYEGIEPTGLWDKGKPGFLSNYSLSANRAQYLKEGETYNSSLQLFNQLNYFDMNFKNYSSLSGLGKSSFRFDNVNTSLHKKLINRKTSISLGDISSSSNIFESFRSTGILYGSDDNMTPPTERIFSPVVRGLANTTAKVDVKQNGYTIYETSVPPGVFEITNVQVINGLGNKLDVEVTESDGSKNYFSVDYSSPLIALPRGRLKHMSMIGKLKNTQPSIAPEYIQTEWIYGLPYNTTIYGGTQLSKTYTAIGAGLSFSLGKFGAISSSLVETQNKSEENVISGIKKNFRYDFSATDFDAVFYSDLSLYGQEYSTIDTNSKNDVLKRKKSADLYIGKSFRNQTDIGFTYSRTESYAKNITTERGFLLSKKINSFNTNFYIRERIENSQRLKSKKDSTVGFSINIPLGSYVYTSYEYSKSSNGKGGQSVNVNGYNESNTTSWAMKHAFATGELSKTQNLEGSITQKKPTGISSHSFILNKEYNDISTNFSGSFFLHNDGLTFGQPTGDTPALVKVKGASDVIINGDSSIRTDSRGYAIVPSLIPYVKNNISLDVNSIQKDIGLKYSQDTIIPTEYSFTIADFHARTGINALISLKSVSGAPLPFGSYVTLKDDTEVNGVVDDNGSVYLSGLPKKGLLLVNSKDAKCEALYTIPESQLENNFVTVNATCSH